jgi:hypothetical protein
VLIAVAVVLLSVIVVNYNTWGQMSIAEPAAYMIYGEDCEEQAHRYRKTGVRGDQTVEGIALDRHIEGDRCMATMPHVTIENMFLKE